MCEEKLVSAVDDGDGLVIYLPAGAQEVYANVVIILDGCLVWPPEWIRRGEGKGVDAFAKLPR